MLSNMDLESGDLGGLQIAREVCHEELFHWTRRVSSLDLPVDGTHAASAKVEGSDERGDSFLWRPPRLLKCRDSNARFLMGETLSKNLDHFWEAPTAEFIELQQRSAEVEEASGDFWGQWIPAPAVSYQRTEEILVSENESNATATLNPLRPDIVEKFSTLPIHSNESAEDGCFTAKAALLDIGTTQKARLFADQMNRRVYERRSRISSRNLSSVTGRVIRVYRNNFLVYLLPLRPGEWVRVRSSLWFKVHRGLLEVRGHIFPPSCAYHLASAFSTSIHCGDTCQGEECPTSCGLRLLALGRPRVLLDSDRRNKVWSELQEGSTSKTEDYSESFAKPEMNQHPIMTSAFLNDFSNAEIPMKAFEDVATAARDTGIPFFSLTDFQGPENHASDHLKLRKPLPIFARHSPMELRYLQVDSRMNRGSLTSEDIEDLLKQIDLAEFPVVVSLAEVRFSWGARIPLPKALALPLGPSILGQTAPQPLELISPLWYYCASNLAKLFLYRAQHPLPNSFQTENEEIYHKCSCSNRLPACVLWGSKSVGKSTFASFLINFLLNIYPKVYLLETDLGQPLMHTPGSISLVEVSAPLLTPAQLLTAACYPRKAASRKGENSGKTGMRDAHVSSEKLYAGELHGRGLRTELLGYFDENLFQGYRVVRMVNVGDVTPKNAPHRFIRGVELCLEVYRQLKNSTANSVEKLHIPEQDHDTVNTDAIGGNANFGVYPGVKKEFRKCAFSWDEAMDSRDEICRFPLIINTGGWVVGTGERLLQFLVKASSACASVFVENEASGVLLKKYLGTLEGCQILEEKEFIDMPKVSVDGAYERMNTPVSKEFFNGATDTTTSVYTSANDFVSKHLDHFSEEGSTTQVGSKHQLNVSDVDSSSNVSPNDSYVSEKTNTIGSFRPNLQKLNSHILNLNSQEVLHMYRHPAEKPATSLANTGVKLNAFKNKVCDDVNSNEVFSSWERYILNIYNAIFPQCIRNIRLAKCNFEIQRQNDLIGQTCCPSMQSQCGIESKRSKADISPRCKTSSSASIQRKSKDSGETQFFCRNTKRRRCSQTMHEHLAAADGAKYSNCSPYIFFGNPGTSPCGIQLISIPSFSLLKATISIMCGEFANVAQAHDTQRLDTISTNDFSRLLPHQAPPRAFQTARFEYLMQFLYAQCETDTNYVYAMRNDGTFPLVHLMVKDFLRNRLPPGCACVDLHGCAEPSKHQISFEEVDLCGLKKISISDCYLLKVYSEGAANGSTTDGKLKTNPLFILQCSVNWADAAAFWSVFMATPLQSNNPKFERWLRVATMFMPQFSLLLPQLVHPSRDIQKLKRIKELNTWHDFSSNVTTVFPPVVLAVHTETSEIKSLRNKLMCRNWAPICMSLTLPAISWETLLSPVCITIVPKYLSESWNRQQLRIVDLNPYQTNAQECNSDVDCCVKEIPVTEGVRLVCFDLTRMQIICPSEDLFILKQSLLQQVWAILPKLTVALATKYLRREMGGFSEPMYSSNVNFSACERHLIRDDGSAFSCQREHNEGSVPNCLGKYPCVSALDEELHQICLSSILTVDVRRGTAIALVPATVDPMVISLTDSIILRQCTQFSPSKQWEFHPPVQAHSENISVLDDKARCSAQIFCSAAGGAFSLVSKREDDSYRRIQMGVPILNNALIYGNVCNLADIVNLFADCYGIHSHIKSMAFKVARSLPPIDACARIGATSYTGFWNSTNISGESNGFALSADGTSSNVHCGSHRPNNSMPLSRPASTRRNLERRVGKAHKRVNRKV